MTGLYMCVLSSRLSDPRPAGTEAANLLLIHYWILFFAFNAAEPSPCWLSRDCTDSPYLLEVWRLVLSLFCHYSLLIVYYLLLTSLNVTNWRTDRLEFLKQTWAPISMGKGRLALPWKSWKVLSRGKNSHVRSQFDRPRRCFSVKIDREWLFNTDYFISVYLYVVVLVFRRKTRGCRTRPQIWDREANASAPQILT